MCSKSHNLRDKMKEYQIIIDLKASTSQKQVELATGFIKEALENSIFKDIISNIYWEEWI